MKKEVKYRLIKHLSFLENELKDYGFFNSLTWEEYNSDRNKRRNVERWIENIINSSIDIAKIILAHEGLPLADTYKDTIDKLSTIAGFDTENTGQLSRWVKLRNIISHEYLDIRWASIKNFISESKLLYEDFFKKVNKYLQEQVEGK